MKEVHRFEAKDGTLFHSIDDCAKHENRLVAVEIVMKGLKPKPDVADFRSDKAYLQHNIEPVVTAMRGIISLVTYDLGDNYEKIMQNPFDYRFSAIGRILDDTDHVLYKAWSRFMCIDSEYREWSLPFYAMNPDKNDHLQKGTAYAL